MASVSRFLTNKLRLKVNEAKSAVARPEERKFLGFSISNDGSERRIAPKALDKFKGQIRDMTRDALPSLWGAPVERDAGAIVLLGAKVPPDRFVEIAESVRLESIGEHPH